jgi:hypothetical protein
LIELRLIQIAAESSRDYYERKIKRARGCRLGPSKFVRPRAAAKTNLAEERRIVMSLKNVDEKTASKPWHEMTWEEFKAETIRIFPQADLRPSEAARAVPVDVHPTVVGRD